MARRRKRAVVLVFVAVGLIAVYAIVGFFAVPAIARNQITSRASAALNRDVALGDVDFNPFTFETSLHALRIAGTGEEPLASWQRATANFDAWESLFGWTWSFGEIVLQEPRLRVVVGPDGKLNLAQLWDQPEADEPGPTLSVSVERLAINEGEVAFVDRSQPQSFSSTIVPISFTLTDFATATDAPGVYHLEAQTERGETLTWDGTLQLAPFRSAGHLAFDQVELPAYEPFLAPFFNGALLSGRARLTGQYEFVFGEQRRASFRDLTLALSNLALALPEQTTPALELGHAELQVPSAEIYDRTARIERVALQDLTVRAVRQRDGSWDFAQFIPAQGSEASTADASGESGGPGFSATVNELALTEGVAVVTDHTTPEPVELRASQITLTAKNASTDLSQPVAVEFGLQWQGGPGSLQGSGTVHPQPFRTELDVSAHDLELAALDAYLQQFTNLAIAQGRLRADGRIDVAVRPEAPAEVTWSGTAAVTDLQTRTPETDAPVVAWSVLSTGPATIGTSPLRFHFQKVAWEGPQFHVVRDEDGGFNLATALTDKRAAPATDAPQAAASAGKQRFETEAEDEEAGGAAEGPAGPPFDFALEELSISGGTIFYEDRSTEPAVRAQVENVTGTVSGVSAQPGATASIHLTGTVDRAAPVALDGTINLVAERVPRPSDVQLDLDNLALEILEPYAARFLGYRIASGFAHADLSYELTQRQLTGRNHLVISNLDLGEAVPGDDALAIPVPFAISVLRDRQGQIELTIPVSGDLGSAKFNFASTVTQALQGALMRAVTAPFSLLASLVGAEPEQLQQVDFPPGESEVNEQGQTRVEAIAEALRQRPGLALKVHWAPARAVDEAELRRARLEELLQQEKRQLAESGRDGTAQGESAGNGIDDATALRSLFAQRFPSEAPAAPAKGAADAGEADADDRPTSLLGAFWRWLAGPRERERDAADDVAPTTEGPSAGAEAFPDPETMRRRLLETIDIDDANLTRLARERAETVQRALVNAGISSERVMVADEPGVPEGAKQADDAGRVHFTLEPAA